MKKLIESRWLVLILAVAGVIALVLLSAALRDIRFRPAVPFSIDLGGLGGPVMAGPAMQIPVWRYMIFVILILMIFSIIMVFIDKDLRKKILMRMLKTVLSMAAIWFFLTYVFDQRALQEMLTQRPSEGAPAAAAANTQLSAPVFTPEPINPWLVYLVSFVVGLLIVLTGWFIYSRRRKTESRRTIADVADIARDALNDLQPGKNWDDAIVRAYIRMNEVVQAERGIIRQPGNTPAEFAVRMERMGFPGEAVRALTGLFEGVRYGGKSSTPAERDLAAAALGAILHYCGQKP